MKPYRDVFGNPLTKTDVDAATRLIVRNSKISPSLVLQRSFKWGSVKVARIIAVLEDAGVVGPLIDKSRIIIFKNEERATNAALRQLKKGKK